MTKESRKKPEASGKTQQSEGKHLHDFEKVPFDHDTTKSKSSDEELNSRYAKGEVRIVTEQARYPLAGILGMLRDVIEDEDGEKELRYKLDPEYQRRHRWSNERKSRLIESFLMNVPVPPVFLYERDLARFEVMDGRQRLTALSDFYADKFELIGLQYWSDLDGRKYSQLPSKIRDGIDRRYISSIILLKETAASEEQAAMLKKMVFERLNSGELSLGARRRAMPSTMARSINSVLICRKTRSFDVCGVSRSILNQRRRTTTKRLRRPPTIRQQRVSACLRRWRTRNLCCASSLTGRSGSSRRV